ncbi:MAG: hypothetical protein IKI57_00545 [Clostridia bacterium]|nr:hypothetical protein [Clostridia bacterium]
MIPNKKVEYYEFSPWVNSRRFKDADELRSFISREDERFLRGTIYPHFINRFVYKNFNSSIPLPLVLKEETKKPKFIVDNDLFTMLFYKAKDRHHGSGWVISFHIKEHWFCDERIKNFRKWLKKNHGNILMRNMSFKGMPSGFYYQKLYQGSVKKDALEKDFCIELFSEEHSDAILNSFCKFMELFGMDTDM